jgi:peptidoglycan/xylan/chitin deacetylase (PgdA/CDA1 family)
MKKYLLILLVLFSVSIYVGCTSQKDVDNDKIDKEVDVDGKDKNETDNNNSEDLNSEDNNDISKEPVQIDYETVKPYELGHIMVVMYHGIIDNPPYHRTEEEFRKDLKYMYDNGYRLISVRDFLDNNINIQAGKTPIVLTFDDALSSTFSLKTDNGNLVPKEGTAVAILEDFAKQYPDFGKTATFYIHVGNKIFEGDGTVEQRLKWLVENGYELGNHTATHANLANLSKEKLLEEIGKVDKLIKDTVDGSIVDSITFPFGKRPLELLDYVKNGKYKDHEYSYKVGFREGPSGAFVTPLDINYNPFNAPRVRGSEGADGDLWWYFNYYKEHPQYKYISDGNPQRVSIPKKYENKVNIDKLGDKELYLY